VLPSLRISSLVLVRLTIIGLFYAVTLLIFVIYIQSIGSGIGYYGGLINMTLNGQSIETLFYLVNAFDINLVSQLLLSSAPLARRGSLELKPRRTCSARLTNAEKDKFVLPDSLKPILVGLLLGDLYGQNRGKNVRFTFKQSIVHEEYLYHLYELFKLLCPSAPKLKVALPHPKTSLSYSTFLFSTYTLACFKELYFMFYPAGKKIIPLNIGELLTPISLAYWIADDGCWNKTNKYVVLCTDSFAIAEIELLISVLNYKFDLKCYKCKNGNNYRIIIPSYSIPNLQSLLASYMPSMMKHKIGL
jgi:hypothetical protein